MADKPIYTNYPSYNSAFDAVQKLNNALYGLTGTRDSGLAGQMDELAASKGENSAEYKKVKAKFDATQKELEAAQTKFNEVRTQIDNEFNAKDAGKKTKSIDQDIRTLQAQKDSLKRQNKTEEAKQVQDQITALKEQRTSINKPAVSTTPDAATAAGAAAGATTDFKGYTLGPDGKLYAPGGTQNAYIVTTPGKTVGTVVSQPYASAAEARNAYLSAYAKTPEQIAALKNQLVASHYLTAQQANSDTWFTGLDDMLAAYSVHVVSQAQYGGAKQAILPTEFLTQKKVSGGAGGAGSITYTTRGAAKRALDTFATDLIGSGASSAEEDAYYKELIKAERQAGTSGLSQADVSLIMANAMRKRLQNTDVNTILSSKSGSKVSTDIAALQEYASNYGVEMSPADALRIVSQGIGQQDYLAKQEERIRQTAIVLHPQLKDHITAGGTVKDIADQYAYAKSKKLNVAVPQSTADKDVMDAVAKGITITDFNRQLQSRPEWWNTPEADATVNNFLDKIGQTWGLA